MTLKTAVSSPNGQVSLRADLKSLYQRKYAVEDLIRSLEHYNRVCRASGMGKAKRTRI